MAATAAPGTTPAVATPTTRSGIHSRATRRARARESSPNSGQSTMRTPLLGSGAYGMGP